MFEKTSTKLLAGFAAMVVMLLLVGGVGLVGAKFIGAKLGDTVEDKFPKTVWANEIIRQVLQIGVAMRDSVLRPDTGKEQVAKIDGYRQKIKEELKLLERTITSPKGVDLLKQVNDARARYIKDQDNFISLVDRGQVEAARQSLLVAEQTQGAYVEAVKRLIQYQTELMQASGQDAESKVSLTQWLILGIGIASMIVAVIIALLIRNSIMGNLGGEPAYAAEAARAVAAGDLTRSIEVDGAAKNSLLANMGEMQRNLKTAMTRLKDAAGKVLGASERLAAAASQVSAGSAHQSEAAGSMAANVEQMTVSVDQVADRANESVEAASGALTQLTSGIEVIGKLVADMQRIASSVHATSDTLQGLGTQTAEIESILGVISGIADQTNLLALNAAIEAARAGEQGRGFAVVADEVRKLAERTGQSTRDITEMIAKIRFGTDSSIAEMQGAVDLANSGAAAANQAGNAMKAIDESTRLAVERVKDIALAMNEQRIAGRGIAEGVERIAQMSEENSVAAQNSADTALELDRLSRELGSIVDQFKL